MLIIRISFIFLLIAAHILGGAALFTRLFPRESTWLGFVLPALAVAMTMNFVEHYVGFSSLWWALPFTLIGSIMLLLSPGLKWRRLWFPMLVFLGAFGFTMTIHGLKPNIEDVRDGRLDAHLIADYSMGSTLPPISTWEAPFKQMHYYSFEHYAASVMDRLMGFDPGTGFNVAGALATALTFFLVAAIAWRLGGGSERKKMVSPLHKRRTVQAVVALGLCSQRRACRYLGLHRSSGRYQNKGPSDWLLGLRKQIEALSRKFPRLGYRKLTRLLMAHLAHTLNEPTQKRDGGMPWEVYGV